MSTHTAGPYLRDGRFVYASTMYALPSGKLIEVNRFSASVSPGHECSQDEAEAVARLFEAALDLLAVARQVDFAYPEPGSLLGNAARAAIAKATGAQP